MRLEVRRSLGLVTLGQVGLAQEHRRGAFLVGRPDPFLRIEVVRRGRPRQDERAGKSEQQSAHRSQRTDSYGS